MSREPSPWRPGRVYFPRCGYRQTTNRKAILLFSPKSGDAGTVFCVPASTRQFSRLTGTGFSVIRKNTRKRSLSLFEERFGIRMRTYRYEEMTPKEFERAVKEMPIFLVPTGLLEWHGNHLPLGLDGLKAHGICCRIAERLEGGIVLPANYLGRPGFSSYLGTLTYSESLVNGYFYELFHQLKKIGARVIFVLTGHYGPLQVECLERVAACFERENPSVRVIAQPEYQILCVTKQYLLTMQVCGRHPSSGTWFPNWFIWRNWNGQSLGRRCMMHRRTIIIMRTKCGNL